MKGYIWIIVPVLVIIYAVNLFLQSGDTLLQTNNDDKLKDQHLQTAHNIIHSAEFDNETIPEYLDLKIQRVFKKVARVQGRQKGVIIMAGYHTGSSFTGRLFSSSPEVFYQFEPLMLIAFGRNWKIERHHQTSISHHLSELLNCNAADIFKESTDMFPSYEHKRVGWIRKTFDSIKDRGIIYGDANSSDVASAIKQLCLKTSSVTVIKVIRAETITSILPLVLDGIKVFNLIRDPRGLARSRYKHSKKIGGPDFLKHMQMECQKQARNIRFLKEAARIPALHDALMANFRLVRYEDIAYDPMGISEKMYKFAGLTFADEAKDYVKQYIPSGGMNASLSRTIASRWKYEMDFDIIRNLEDICKENMESLGFAKLNKEKHYREDTFEVLTDVTTDIPYVFH